MCEVGDHHQLKRQAVLADTNAANAPSAAAARKDGLERGLRRPAQAEFDLQIGGATDVRERRSPGSSAGSAAIMELTHTPTPRLATLLA
jgi:hypothetical protein